MKATDEPAPRQARPPARERLANRRRRAWRIRKGVIGGSAAAFATAWAMIFFQLVSGHDPGLAASGQGAATAAAASSTSSGSSEGEGGEAYSTDPYWDDGAYSDGGAYSASPAPSGSAATAPPVTTRQS